MRFEQALQAMREGKKVRVKTGNPSIDQWLLWLKLNEENKQIFFLGINDDMWQCPQGLFTRSILSEDWEVVDD